MYSNYKAPIKAHFHYAFLISLALILFATGYYLFNEIVPNHATEKPNPEVTKIGRVAISTIGTRNSPRIRNLNRSFTIDYKNDQFLKDGQPFNYVSGSMHYFRVPRAYWRDRLRKIRAAGLKVVCTYVEWATHEPSPRRYKFTGEQDVEYFLQLAAEEDLLVILRPGPFICAERDLGGFPPWLMSLYPNITFRTNDSDYMREVKTWFEVLFTKLQKHFYGNGGPVITVQVENEYGYTSCNVEYKIWLRDLMKSYVQEKAVLFTTDPATNLKCGSIPDVYATIDFSPGTNLDQVFKLMRQYSPHGPLVCSEFYDGWFNAWGQKRAQTSIESILPTMRRMLKMKVNFNFYMFEGGTNFGFTADSQLVTSYDYDAALDEAGDPTPKYYALRNLISEYFDMPKIPVPKPAPKGKYGEVTLRPVLSIFNYSRIPEAKTVECNATKSFEELKLSYGYVLYETTIPEADEPDPVLLSAPGVKDRAIVFVNKNLVTVFSASRKITSAMLEMKPGSRLSFLVENQGHGEFGSEFGSGDRKGLLQNPTLNGKSLNSWTMTTLPFQNITWAYDMKPRERHIRPPAIYVGELVLPSNATPLDTFVDPTGWGKGIIFVNGINLGRYWPSIGSQVTLYVPGCYLLPAPQKNMITIFETEYTQPEQKIVFTDKPNLNHVPPQPVNEMQESPHLYVRGARY